MGWWILGFILMIILIFPVITVIKTISQALKKSWFNKNYESKIIYSKVVGVTHRNDNRTSRQKIIKNSKPGEDIFIIQSPSDEFPNAVKVCNGKGEQLGWLNQELAQEMTKYFNEGWTIQVIITNITGGEEDKPTYGCNIKIGMYRSYKK